MQHDLAVRPDVYKARDKADKHQGGQKNDG